MATTDEVNFRLAPIKESKRPLSTYDNLNTHNATEIKSNTVAGITAVDNLAAISLNGNNFTMACENVNEFPFDDISFRFDELQNRQQQSPNGYDNVNNNNIDINYKLLRSNNNSRNMGSSSNNNNLQSSEHAIINGPHQMRSNHQGYAMTTTDQNHSAMPIASSSSISSGNNSGTSSSSSNVYPNSLADIHQYENMADDATSTCRNIDGKPVHSDAKSLFLGLSNSTQPQIHTPNSNNRMTYNNHVLIKSNLNLEKNPKTETLDEYGNTGGGGDGDESSPPNEDEALLSNYSNSNSNIIASAGPSRFVSSVTTTVQYQNVPSNSQCFGQKQNSGGAAIASNGCTCQCSDLNAAEIKQCESDQYKCNDCLRSSGAAATTTTSSSSTNTSSSMANGTVYSTSGGDLASCSTSMKSAKPITLDTSTSYRMSQSLSQAVYMSTTVPQNIKGSNIMGSHLPTRNSLRHSRMLVGNKNYQVPRRRNPLSIRHPLSARNLYALHVLVGLAVACLGLWLCWWAPSTRARENPYWSGLVLMLSGILGLIVIAFKRIPRHKLRQHLFTFLRINSSFVTFMATLCAFLASSFAIFHLTSILSPMAVCQPVHMLVESSACICRFDNVTAANESQGGDRAPKLGGERDIAIGSYYRDLSCIEVMGPFKYILIASAVLNFIGFLLCFTLLLVLCVRQKPVKRVPYSSANSRNRL